MNETEAQKRGKVKLRLFIMLFAFIIVGSIFGMAYIFGPPQ